MLDYTVRVRVIGFAWALSIAALPTASNSKTPEVEKVDVSPPVVVRLDKAVAGLRELGGPPLLAQQSVRRWTVFTSCSEASRTNVTTAIAASACAEWREAEQALVLTDTPGAERLTAMDPRLASAELSSVYEAFSITPAQAEVLRAGKVVAAVELLPHQVLLLRRAAFYSYAHSASVGPELFLLKGVFLATAQGHPGVAPGEMAIIFPSRDGSKG